MMVICGATGMLIHCWWECKLVPAATLEDSLAASYKIKHTLTMWFSNYAVWYLLKWVEILCSHENLQVIIYSSFIHNYSKLEATKVYFRRWMDKQIIVHSYNEILFGDKTKWAIRKDKKRHGRNLNAFFLVKEASLKLLHMIPTVQHSGKVTIWKGIPSPWRCCMMVFQTTVPANVPGDSINYWTHE